MATSLVCKATTDLEGLQLDRYHALNYELRCVTCANQSISDSSAPVAQAMKDQVANLITQGFSDEQIKSHFQTIYGDYVLYTPQLNDRTALLWGLPVIILLAAIAFWWFRFCKE